MPKRSELKLTKRAVDALSVEVKDAVFWDRDLAGFGVRGHARDSVREAAERVAESIATDIIGEDRRPAS